jgi:hypothetical protein
MKKFAVLAGLVAVALLLGMAGTAVRSDKAQAKPEDVITFSPNVCTSLTTTVLEGDWNNDGDYDAAVDKPLGLQTCTGLANGINTPGGLAALAIILGADVDHTIAATGAAEILPLCNNGVDDDADTVIDDGCPVVGDINDPALYQDLNDLSGTQLGDYSVASPQKSDGKLWVLAFVSNDENVKFEADEGAWLVGGVANGSAMTCTTDEDCDADGTKGDKVVVEQLLGNGVADLGDAELVATQAGVDVIYDYVVVGAPDSIDVSLLTDGNVQEGIKAADCADDPHLTPLDSSVFTDGAAEPEKNGLLATITDDDGTELAGIFVDWTSDDEDVANLNLDRTVSWALESGTMAANLFCGDAVGTATITGTAISVVTWSPAVVDKVDDGDVDVTVLGAPDAMTLTASPASITCDGVNSSTVSAALVDSDGNKVVDGTDVRFEVVALGISDPIKATTADGAATSKITPLSLASAGVVVMVTTLDADGDVALEGNIRIDCAPAVAPPVAPPVSPTGPTVKPPGTGDGGYLP